MRSLLASWLLGREAVVSRARREHHRATSSRISPPPLPYHPAEVISEGHPLAQPLLLRAGAAAAQRVTAHDACWDRPALSKGHRQGCRHAPLMGLTPGPRVPHTAAPAQPAGAPEGSWGTGAGTWGLRQLQALQAVAAGGVEAALGEASLAAGEHGSRGDDAQRRLLPHPQVQLLDLLLLGTLQQLHLSQVPGEEMGADS